ncbi:MAG: ABC transporter permease [Ignavibacteriaceae bacterium]
MLFNYLKETTRNLARFKIYTIINVAGLAIGLAAVILITVNIIFEYSFNSFHSNESHIYRIGTTFERQGKTILSTPEFVAALGPAMMGYFPEIKNFVRISSPDPIELTDLNNSYSVDKNVYADSSFFDVFSFKLLEGNKKLALSDPYSIVLTKSTAALIFGKSDPLGKVIIYEKAPYNITGIAADPPENSDIQFNSLISFSTLSSMPNSQHFLGWKGGNQFITYVQLKKNSSPKELSRKFPDFLWPHLNNDLSNISCQEILRLEPLKDIHLHYNDDSISIRSNVDTFSIIAIFILIIASLNFVNLSTARGIERAKAVGVRKVLGAKKNSLVIQFLAESIAVCTIAFLLAIMLVELLIPLYDNLINKHLVLAKFMNWEFISFLLILLIFTSIASGLYPALCLSNYKVINVLKGNLLQGKQKLVLRKSLVIFQFVVSIFLIVSTFVINEQLRYIRDKDPGFIKNDILVIPLTDNKLKEEYEVFKTKLKQIRGVVNVTASSNVPLAPGGFTSNGYLPEGYNSPLMIHALDCGANFLNTYGIKLLAGRNFNNRIASDQKGFLINESMAKLLPWSNPVGKIILRNGNNTIIGVVKDFNYSSLYHPIQPLIITDKQKANHINYISVKLLSSNMKQTLALIKNAWNEFAPGIAFDYHFLDEGFDKTYRADIIFHEMFAAFSALAMIVALLGLLGLVSYSISLRTKEIGMRKVLGASVLEINRLLVRDYIKWEIIANIIAWPIAYILLRQWLQRFAYKINFNVWMFVDPSIIVLTAACTLVSMMAFRISIKNPTESLRSE